MKSPIFIEEHGNTKMVAHRGLSGIETENTAAAFVAAGNRGYWGSETASVAKRCVIKRRKSYLHKNATALAQRLLGVTVDGKCGANTEAAIKRFQRENALSVDGECGINTWKMLLEVK